MRRQGFVDSPDDVGANGHACWSFHDAEDDLCAAAGPFLTEGAALGQALLFVGGPEAEQAVRTVEPMRSMVARGLLQVVPFEDVFPGGRRRAHVDQWTALTDVLEFFRRAGYTGVRVLAEVTSLADPDDNGLAHALWESYADSRMAGTTLAALCCFRREALSTTTLTTIASAHPVVDRRLADLVPFRLFGNGDTLVIEGELDAFSADTLRHLLLEGGGRTDRHVLDLEGLRFVDHATLRVLGEYAARVRAHGAELTVRGGPPSLPRLAALLEVDL